MAPNNPQNYIKLTDGYLVLDTCLKGVGVTAIPRGLQINIAGITQLQIPSSSSFIGQGDGYIAVDNNGNISFSTGSGGGGGGSPTGPAGGDLGGTYPNPSVVNIQGQPVSTQTPGPGQVLEWTGLQWEAANLPTIPTSLPPSGPASGDLGGTYPSPEVTGLLNNSLPSLVDGYLNWNGGWQLSSLPSSPTSLPPDGPAGGDLSNTYPNPTVAKINGASVPAAGSLTTGNTVHVTGSSTLSYGALNLAGGSNYVTGTLPTGNQANQSVTLTGDTTGTGTTASTTTTVVALQGNAVKSESLTSTQDGYVLTWTNGSSQWQAEAPTGGGGGGGTTPGMLFTSSGTWTCPTGVSFVSLIGSGGGNGGSGGNTGFAGGAGGTGGDGATQTIVNNVPVIPGTNYTITIGTGGTAGAGGVRIRFWRRTGGTGTNTTFVGGTISTITFAGGSGAAGGAGGIASASGTLVVRK